MASRSRPQNILDAVARGIDMFDRVLCVLPIRNGCTALPSPAMVRSSSGTRATPTIHARSTRPAPARPRTYSRACLQHLMKAGEMLGAMLLSEVNIAYDQELTAGERAALAAGQFAEFHAPPRPSGTGAAFRHIQI